MSWFNSQPTSAVFSDTGHLTCPTNDSNPVDPPSPTYPWLPFITDECSIPQGLVQGIET